MSQIDKQGYVTIGHFAYKLRGMTSEQKQVLAAKLIKRWELTQAQEDALRLLENSEDDLLMIHSMLKFCYPHDSDLRFSWIKVPSKAFQGMSPIDLIILEGMSGIKRIRSYLSGAM